MFIIAAFLLHRRQRRRGSKLGFAGKNPVPTEEEIIDQGLVRDLGNVPISSGYRTTTPAAEGNSNVEESEEDLGSASVFPELGPEAWGDLK